jgi:hypothetical protein
MSSSHADNADDSGFCFADFEKLESSSGCRLVSPALAKGRLHLGL